MAEQGIQCWLIDLASDLRLETVLDGTIGHVADALPGREFALLIFVEEELTVVRTSGLGPGARRRLEMWARSYSDVLEFPVEIAGLREDPELAAIVARLSHGSLRSIPLLFKGRALGVLIALAPEDMGFDDDDRRLLSAFGEQASVALANAHTFQTLLERQLGRELERSSRYGEIFSLAIIDLDGFKELNDSRGHQAGDRLLRQAADTIQEACRASDVAGRIGGDEFALLLPETNQFAAAALCERLRIEIETLGNVSLSWGVAEYPTHGVTINTLTRAADAAMYASKPRLVGGERALTGRAG